MKMIASILFLMSLQTFANDSVSCELIDMQVRSRVVYIGGGILRLSGEDQASKLFDSSDRNSKRKYKMEISMNENDYYSVRVFKVIVRDDKIIKEIDRFALEGIPLDQKVLIVRFGLGKSPLRLQCVRD
ncbi:MAG: hypothetical protein H6621_11165 [Halobacteriovoraceae bacterium]|nr:hypothetical protein [Halobacteriovoraceae bacterium]MCB9095618.1 hypothetical protein [Halobacteriovoraceae bacterium]